MKRRQKPYRDGFVHVLADRCETCIFRPGNRMDLQPGRVKGMVKQARKNESAIICHSTLGGAEAVCRGFFDLYPTQPLQLAERLGRLREVPCP